MGLEGIIVQIKLSIRWLLHFTSKHSLVQ